MWVLGTHILKNTDLQDKVLSSLALASIHSNIYRTDSRDCSRAMNKPFTTLLFQIRERDKKKKKKDKMLCAMVTRAYFKLGDQGGPKK